MKIIDAHVHIFNIPNYINNLISTINDNKIEKSCISGIGKFFNCVNNDEVKLALKQHPDRFIGAFFVRPGINIARDIDDAYSQGFKMLKTTLPLIPYDDPSFFPLCQKAEDLKMPILFHTGVITLLKKPKIEYISS